MASIMSTTEPPPDEDASDEAHVAIIFEVFLLRLEEASEAQHNNPYVQKLSDDSFLSILQPCHVKKPLRMSMRGACFCKAAET